MSRRLESIELAMSGMPPREIADVVGVQRNTVYQYLREARREGIGIPRFKATGPHLHGPVFRLPRTVLAVLDLEAARRGTDVRSLVQELLELIARDGLVDAVLDDGAQNQPSNPTEGGHHDPDYHS